MKYSISVKWEIFSIHIFIINLKWSKTNILRTNFTCEFWNYSTKNIVNLFKRKHNPSGLLYSFRYSSSVFAAKALLHIFPMKKWRLLFLTVLSSLVLYVFGCSFVLPQFFHFKMHSNFKNCIFSRADLIYIRCLDEWMHYISNGSAFFVSIECIFLSIEYAVHKTELR